MRLVPAALCGVTFALALRAFPLAAQQPPPPQPFPRPAGSAAPPPAAPSQPAGSPAPAAPAATTAAPAPGEAPTDASLGIPGIIFPSAQFLSAFELGRGQRCYLFGTDMSYAELVAYYKNVLKDGGRELFKAPAMQQFDLGKFQDETMAAPPSVVVKDYTFAGGEGYLHVDGMEMKRFKTVIQIVPMPGR